MSYPRPVRHIITAVDADEGPVPAAYRTTCRRGDDHKSEFSLLHLPEGIRVFARNQREEGYEVEVEELAEVPDEMFAFWLLAQLTKLMPPSRREELGNLGSLAVERYERLRSGKIAERAGDRLFVAVEPDDDEVLALVFTRGKPLIFSRVGEEWVRSSGVGDYDYKHMRMVAVNEGVLQLYDERRSSGHELMLSELYDLGLVGE